MMMWSQTGCWCASLTRSIKVWTRAAMGSKAFVTPRSSWVFLYYPGKRIASPTAYILPSRLPFTPCSLSPSSIEMTSLDRRDLDERSSNLSLCTCTDYESQKLAKRAESLRHVYTADVGRVKSAMKHWGFTWGFPVWPKITYWVH